MYIDKHTHTLCMCSLCLFAMTFFCRHCFVNISILTLNMDGYVAAVRGNRGRAMTLIVTTMMMMLMMAMFLLAASRKKTNCHPIEGKRVVVYNNK